MPRSLTLSHNNLPLPRGAEYAAHHGDMRVVVMYDMLSDSYMSRWDTHIDGERYHLDFKLSEEDAKNIPTYVQANALNHQDTILKNYVTYFKK